MQRLGELVEGYTKRVHAHSSNGSKGANTRGGGFRAPVRRQQGRLENPCVGKRRHGKEVQFRARLWGRVCWFGVRAGWRAPSAAASGAAAPGRPACHSATQATSQGHRPGRVSSCRQGGPPAVQRQLSTLLGDSRRRVQRPHCPSLGCLLPGLLQAGCSAWARQLTPTWGCPSGCAGCDRPWAACSWAQLLAHRPLSIPAPPAALPAPLGRARCRRRWAAASVAALHGTAPGLRQGEQRQRRRLAGAARKQDAAVPHSCPGPAVQNIQEQAWLHQGSRDSCQRLKAETMQRGPSLTDDEVGRRLIGIKHDCATGLASRQHRVVGAVASILCPWG